MCLSVISLSSQTRSASASHVCVPYSITCFSSCQLLFRPFLALFVTLCTPSRVFLGFSPFSYTIFCTLNAFLSLQPISCPENVLFLSDVFDGETHTLSLFNLHRHTHLTGVDCKQSCKETAKGSLTILLTFSLTLIKCCGILVLRHKISFVICRCHYLCKQPYYARSGEVKKKLLSD